jgi:hypothetical protein
MHQVFNFISPLLAKASLHQHFIQEGTKAPGRMLFRNQVLTLNLIHSYYEPYV